MTRRLRRTASLGALPVTVILIAAGSPRVVNAATVSPPVITRVSPQVVVENGQPVRITLTGSGLSTVATVFLSPVVADRSFVAFSDTTLLVTLPANLTPGEYSITVSSPAGSSDAGAAVFGVQPSAAPVSSGASGPVTIPRYTFDPYPAGAGKGDAPVQAPAVATTPQQVRVGTVTSSNQVSDPVIVAAVGVVAGTLLYLLWGRPGRVDVARRKGFFAQVVVRPVQRLHLGRICLQCGRLHWVFRTRSDLWRAGAYCSATCFVAAQCEDLDSRRADTRAVGRLRELGIYVELENKLALIFAGEAASVGLASNLFGAETAEAPLDSKMASWTVVAVPAPVQEVAAVPDAAVEDVATSETIDPGVEVPDATPPAADLEPAVVSDETRQERRRRRWWPWSHRTPKHDAERASDAEDSDPALLPFQPDELDAYDAAMISAADRAAELIDFDIAAFVPSGGEPNDEHDPTQSILAASTLAEAAHIIERVTLKRRAATATEVTGPVEP